MQDELKKDYKTVFKTTALFGGVQLITIVLGIIKSKFVAIWLGPSGYGIMSLFSSTTDLISYITNLGLQSSAVRDIANANGSDDKILVSKIIKAINRLVIFTGLVGASITIILSPLLSNWLFESDLYTISFIILSSVILLKGIYSGNYATLQGTSKLKLLASANIFGALAGFLCSLPMFYFFKENGIVWAMLLTAASTTIISFIYVNKVEYIHIEQTYRQSIKLGLSALKLGIMMSIGGIIASSIQFGIKSIILKSGNVSDVGLYEAGWVINSVYLGLIFSAMTRDFFPRLSQNINNQNKVSSILNQQIEIAIIIIAPMIISMVVFLPLLIRMFYSTEFLEAISMTRWILIGSLIKVGSWGISYVFLAKGDGKLYLFNEIAISAFMFPCYYIFFNWFGLLGIGYTFTLTYILYFLWVSIMSWKKYKLKYKSKFWKLFFVFLFLILIFPFGELLWSASYLTGVFLVILVSIYSIWELNKRIELKSFFKK